MTLQLVPSPAHPMPVKVPHVMVCVCTYKRPRLLRACLESLLHLEAPKGYAFSICVIDNDADMTAYPTYSQIELARIRAGTPDIELLYLCERERGIAAARNHALAFSNDKGANYVAFIDDDAEATPDWLNELMNTPEKADIVLGSVFWPGYAAYPEWKRPKKDGGKGAGAGNMRLSRRVIQHHRFDESLGLGGGEDGLFTAQALKAGFSVMHQASAIVNEVVHPERMTVSGILDRAYWTAAANMREELHLHGRWRATARRAGNILVAPFECALALLLAALIAPFKPDRAKRKALRALKALAVAKGRIMGIVGHVPQSYAHTVGT